MMELRSIKRSGRLWVVIVYLIFLLLLIPWYWPADDLRQVFGFPLWALTSLGVLLTISIFTAWLCLRKDEPDE